MLVKNWMNPNIISIDANESVQHAVKLIKENEAPMLIVKENGKLAGIVTDRDIKRATASDHPSLEIYELIYVLANIKVKQIMTKNPITIPVEYTVEEAAEMLLANNISGLPVVDETGETVGSISQTDIFRLIIALTGVGKRGIQFAFKLADKPGSIKAVADIIREHGGRMVSLLTSYENVETGYRKVYIRIYSLDRAQLSSLIESLKEKAEILYMVDHRENRRVIF